MHVVNAPAESFHERLPKVAGSRPTMDVGVSGSVARRAWKSTRRRWRTPSRNWIAGNLAPCLRATRGVRDCRHLHRQDHRAAIACEEKF